MEELKCYRCGSYTQGKTHSALGSCSKKFRLVNRGDSCRDWSLKKETKGDKMKDDYEYSMTGTTGEKSWTKQVEIMHLTIDGLIDRVIKLEEEVEELKLKQEKLRKPISIRDITFGPPPDEPFPKISKSSIDNLKRRANNAR